MTCRVATSATCPFQWLLPNNKLQNDQLHGWMMNSEGRVESNHMNHFDIKIVVPTYYSGLRDLSSIVSSVM